MVRVLSIPTTRIFSTAKYFVSIFTSSLYIIAANDRLFLFIADHIVVAICVCFVSLTTRCVPKIYATTSLDASMTATSFVF